MNTQSALAQRVGEPRSRFALVSGQETETECRRKAPTAGDLLLDRGDFQIRLARGTRRGDSDILVQRMYSWRGYEVSHDGAALEDRRTMTVQACHGRAVFGTLNVGFDVGTGLASDGLYRREI